MAMKVRNESIRNFLEKAEEYYGAALVSFQSGRHNASLLDSSQAVIMANDALCITMLGKRPSKDHREAIQMHIEACKSRENKKDIITLALEKRGDYGYTEKRAGQEEAHRLLLRARRFIDWVKDRTAT